MIPGLDKIKVVPVTLIINTNLRASKLMPLMNEWKGVKYFEITENKTVSIRRVE